MKKIFLLVLLLGFNLLNAQTAFRHLTSTANTSEHVTTLDHPQLNGNPNALLQISSDYRNTYHASIAGVRYNGSKWTIYSQDRKVMPQGLQFNVLVEAAGENHFVHVANAANTGNPNAGTTTIRHPKLDKNPSAILIVTQNNGANQVYNASEVAVWYTGEYWNIYNEDQSKMPVGASFNVRIVADNAMVHDATAGNIWGQVRSATETTYGKSEDLLFITHNGTQGPWNPNPTGVYFPPGRTKWSILTGNTAAMPERARFNIAAFKATTQAPLPNLTGFYRGENGSCGQFYLRHLGDKIYWFGEHPDGSWANVFSGTLNGNTISGQLWDVPKGSLLNKGQCQYSVSSDGSTLIKIQGNIGCITLNKAPLPVALPASKPMKPGSGALTGIWDCNDGAVTYLREDGNDVVFFSEAKHNGTRPGFANVYFGKRNGGSITGIWVDVPKGTALGNGTMALRVASDKELVRSDNGSGYGGSAWTREKSLISVLGSQNQKTLATVYMDCNFLGQSNKLKTPVFTLEMDVYTFKLADLKLPDNSISSIQLEPGYKASLIDDSNAAGNVFVPITGSIKCLSSVAFDNKTSSISIWKEETPLNGWVDMHAHPMSHLGFGKKLIHGAPDIGSIVPAGTSYRGFDVFKKECNEQDEIAMSLEHALGKCSATHQEWAPDNDCGNAIRRIVIGKMEEGKACQSVHGNKFGGPDFKDWPKQDDITHQKMWVDWIERAHKNGRLSVMVALAVNNKTLADAIAGDAPTDDKGSADLQIEEMKKFVDRHDFMEIAYTAKDVRRIVLGGKLAVILGLEIDNIGNFLSVSNLTDNMIAQEIKRLHDTGVRYIFPIHVIDNKFGGTAVYDHSFNYSNKRETGQFWEMECGKQEDKIDYYFSDQIGPQLGGYFLGQDPFREATTPPACTGLGHVNTKSLSREGEVAIKEMMKLGMMIDIDHMSEKSANRALYLAEQVPNGGYPLNSGHNGHRGEKGSEKSRTTEQLARIAKLNGMVGVGCEDATAEDFLKNYANVHYLMTTGGNLNAVPGIGTDINGLVKGPKARPGSNVRYDSAFPKCRTGNKSWDYNQEGVAHYGLMADFVKDMQSINKTYTDNYFMKSAEYFTQMWEKCERQKSRVR